MRRRHLRKKKKKQKVPKVNAVECACGEANDTVHDVGALLQLHGRPLLTQQTLETHSFGPQHEDKFIIYEKNGLQQEKQQQATASSPAYQQQQANASSPAYQEAREAWEYGEYKKYVMVVVLHLACLLEGILNGGFSWTMPSLTSILFGLRSWM